MFFNKKKKDFDPEDEVDIEEFTIDDLEEDLSLEDFEDEDDESGINDLIPEELDYLIFPANKTSLSILEDRFNPQKILESENLIGFKPINTSSPYMPIKKHQVTFEFLQEYFLTDNINLDSTLFGNKNLVSQFNNMSKNIENVIESKIVKDNKNSPKNKPKNKKNKYYKKKKKG
tara:strand:- start:84408 stop:84929 length:522 start_codon:yes stop_codon:yes gene_type:complete